MIGLTCLNGSWLGEKTRVSKFLVDYDVRNSAWLILYNNIRRYLLVVRDKNTVELSLFKVVRIDNKIIQEVIYKIIDNGKGKGEGKLGYLYLFDITWVCMRSKLTWV